MTAGAQTLSLEETLLEPQALPPPPTRHALLVILLALAALLHVATIGSGDLYSQTEGQYAGAAREMVEAHQWLLPTNDGAPRLQKPPLLYWLIIVSFKVFGVNAAAARLPDSPQYPTAAPSLRASVPPWSTPVFGSIQIPWYPPPLRFTRST